MPGPYIFKQIFAADPSNTANVATNASILLFAPGDAAKTPLVITDASTGRILANPVETNANGFGPTFAHESLDQVAWEGGGFTGTFESYRGMKDAADAAAGAAQASATSSQEAAAAAELAAANAAAGAETALAATVGEAEAAKVAAQAAAGLVGAPAGAAVLAAIQPGGAAHGELSAAIDAEVLPVFDAVAALPVSAELGTFGDSITASGQGGGIKWPQLVSDYLGLTVYNPSVPGEAPPDIAVRQGGLAPKLTVAGDTIPASGPVTVSAVSPTSGWRTLPDQTRIGRFTGRLCGVTGELRNDNGAWTFTRTTDGASVPCPPASRFRVDGSKGVRSGIQILWAGRNYPDVNVIIRDTATMVSYIEGTPKRFLVLGVLTTGTEILGSAGHTAILNIDAAETAAYPDNFLDIRRHLIDNGLAEEGITPTSQDLIDIANDTVPSSLRDDNTHPNASGIRVIARKVALTLIEKGWASKSQAFIPAPANGATTLSLPTASAHALRANTAELQSAPTLSLRVIFTPTGTMPVGPANLLGKQSAGLGRAWSFYVYANGNMRLQRFDANQASDFRESTGGTPFVTGERIGVRADFTPGEGVKFYRSNDGGATWTLFNTSSPMNAAIYTGSTQPVKLGESSAMLVESVKILSADGATTYVNEDFTDGTAPNWTLNNGATFAANWPYA